MATEKRLIDANALFKAITTDKIAWRFGVPNTLGLMFDWLKIIIKEQPTVDAVEVVHGRWNIAVVDDDEFMTPIVTGYWCNRCWKPGEKHFNYCPNCGAKMDGDGNECC